MSRSLEGVIYDLRLALRGLLRDRAFVIAAIAMLALAIGLNVTVFTVMNAMVFRGAPLAKRSDRLVYIDLWRPTGRAVSVLYTDFEAWRSHALVFDGLAFAGGAEAVTLREGHGRPIDTTLHRISANTFGVLGVQPALGRDFVPADEATGAPAVIILSDRFWKRRLNKRSDVIGSTVRINDAAVTVVGVMPEGFVHVYEQDLWMPLAHTADLAGGVFGRLRDGATRSEARAELEIINRSLSAADPVTDRRVAIAVWTYSQAHVGPDASIIYGSLWVEAWADVNGETLKGRWHILPQAAAAGLWTTPMDLARFAIELRESYKGKSNLVLSVDMTRQMLTKQLGGYGLGLWLGGKATVTNFSHPGQNEGFTCILAACLDTVC